MRRASTAASGSTAASASGHTVPDQSFAFLRLVHINQQIWREFLSLKHQNLRFFVKLVDAHIFHRDLLATSTIKMTEGTIGIDLTDIRADSEAINVYPLLKFIYNHPGIKLQSKRPELSPAATYPGSLVGLLCNTIARLLNYSTKSADDQRAGKWRRYLDESGEELWITHARDPRYRLVVSHAATEWWMGGAGNAAALEIWMQKTFFPMQRVYGHVSRTPVQKTASRRLAFQGIDLRKMRQAFKITTNLIYDDTVQSFLRHAHHRWPGCWRDVDLSDVKTALCLL